MRVSRDDARATQFAMLAGVLVLGHHVAVRSLREGIFLGTFTVAQLPKAMLGAAIAAIPMALLVSRWMTRFGPGRLAPILFVLSALASFMEWWLLPVAPKPVAIALYLHVSIGSALLVSAFWSIINERFDPHTLKSVVGRIGGASTFGGLLGGLMMERVAHWLSPRTSLLVIGVVALGAAACTQRLGATLVTAKVTSKEKTPGERLTGYLRTLALLVACTAAVSAFGDFALKQAAVARFTSTESLVRFFAIFYTAAALVGFLLQTLVSRRLLDTIGVGGTLCVPPLIGVGLGVLALVSPSLLTVGALRGGDLSLGPSLYRTAFEPLFTPVAAASKRRAKALIDVVFDKGGETAASLAILGLLMGGAAIVQRAPLLLAAVCSALAVFLSLRAQRGYVVELEASLRAGTVHDDLPDADDARRLLLSATTLGTDRGQLLEQIARMRQAKSETTEPIAAPPLPRESVEQLVSHVRVLLGADTRAIRELLARPDLDPRLAAFVVPYLGSNDFVKLAVSALRQMGEGAFGVLSDAMYSAQHSAAVRRRIPHVLRNARGERAVRTLFWALSADNIEVRYRAALALSEVVRDDKKLLPDKSLIEALVLTEVARGPLDANSLNHVFALLALTMHRGSLELARQGMLSQDRKLRGTALEYLESLLSETVRAPLLSALAELAGPHERAAASQPDADLLEELRRSFQADVSPPTLATDPD